MHAAAAFSSARSPIAFDQPQTSTQKDPKRPTLGAGLVYPASSAWNSSHSRLERPLEA
jgi:hypothetical protein